MRYPALIDGKKGAYGVVFPDLDGIVAMGKTVDEAMLNAEEALRDCAQETSNMPRPTPPEDIVVPEGSMLVSVPLIRVSGKKVRANMTIDEGALAFIDAEAKRRGMTRTSYVEYMASRVAKAGG